MKVGVAVSVAALLAASVVLGGCGGGQAAYRAEARAPRAAYATSDDGWSASSEDVSPLEAPSTYAVAEATSDRSEKANASRPPRPAPEHGGALGQATPSAPAPSPAGAEPDAPSGPPPVSGQTQASSPASGKETSEATPRKNRDFVIYTARFTMAVYQVEPGLQAVEKIARDNGGYLDKRTDREITVRVPRERFDATLAALDGVGDVLQRDISAEDVTEAHVDLEIRIANARALQQRLRDLLGRANVDQALAIEKELHRVTEELERLEGRLKVLRDRVAFSTVTVSFRPRGSNIPTPRAHLPFAWLRAVNLASLLSLSEDE